MTPLREAVILPAIFLTATLLGGFRVAETIRLVPPTLTALVLAIILMGTLVRGHVFVPGALMGPHRRPAENLSGAIVVLTVFSASAQAINLLIPDTGLLHAAFATILFVQLLTMNAAGTVRTGTLRTLLVLLGSMFVLRFVVIEALYAPEGGLLQRVLTALLSGATLGGIAYTPNAQVTGYVAFTTLVLYVIGLVMLPYPGPPAALTRHSNDGVSIAVTSLLLLVLAGTSACHQAETPRNAASPAAAGPAPAAADPSRVSPEIRAAALRSAHVWRAPAVPVARANLKVNPPDAGVLDESAEIDCRLVVKAMGGTTPKFDCALPDGSVIRVKYGRGNPEVRAEVAATRLLAALGFGADRMYTIKAVRCAGCSSFPFHSLRCLAQTHLERACFPGGVDYADVTRFDDMAIERRIEGRRIEAEHDQGWSWFELDAIDPRAGGAPRAHVDALKLMAIILAHWDNKAENQRLVCLPGGDTSNGGCSRPFALVQDLGASFGPMKLDLHNWRTLPVWADARTCRVSMEALPWDGGTFPEGQISEEGRRFLLELLEPLTFQQLQDLFAGARVQSSDGITAEGRRPEAWAAAFQDKIRQVREGGPCPPAAPRAAR